MAATVARRDAIRISLADSAGCADDRAAVGDPEAPAVIASGEGAEIFRQVVGAVLIVIAEPDESVADVLRHDAERPFRAVRQARDACDLVPVIDVTRPGKGLEAAAGIAEVSDIDVVEGLGLGSGAEQERRGNGGGADERVTQVRLLGWHRARRPSDVNKYMANIDHALPPGVCHSRLIAGFSYSRSNYS